MRKIAGTIVGSILIFNLMLASGKEEVSFPKVKGWKLNVSADIYTPDNLWDLINGGAESYLSYDFIDLHLADYTSKKGVEIHVETYRHSSTNNAFGIYSTERSPEYNFVDAGIQGYTDKGILNFYTGNYYIKLYSSGSGEMLQSSLLELGQKIADHMDGEKTWPELLGSFPPEGKLPNKDHYVRENFIGFNFLHSAFTAEYEGGYRLFVIQGQDREEILGMVKAYLEFTRQDIDPENQSKFIIKDKYNGDIPVVLKGSYMLGIIDGAGNNEALKALDSLVKDL